MKKLAVIALLSVSIIAPTYAMEIKDYPRSLAQLEFCVKAQMNKKIAVPEGCRSVWERVVAKVSR